MPQQQPRCRTSAPYFSLITLACTVVLAVVLPIAVATAGPSAVRDEGAGATASVPAPPASASHGTERAGAGTRDGARSVEPAGGGPRGDEAGEREAAAGHRVGGASASCGPELRTREGLSAQTCVVSEDGRTWARTYYRNATRSPLRAALTLMRPDGSALSANCAMRAGGRPGVCETPRELSRAGGRPYVATAEAGTADGNRMLLRSASNSVAG